jgi:hypothetical protein
VLAYCNRGIARSADIMNLWTVCKARDEPYLFRYYNNKGIVNDIKKMKKSLQYTGLSICTKLKKIRLKEDDYTNQVIRICDEFNRCNLCYLCLYSIFMVLLLKVW